MKKNVGIRIGYSRPILTVRIIYSCAYYCRFTVFAIEALLNYQGILVVLKLRE